MVERRPSPPIGEAARNERRKAAAACNALAVAFFVSACLQPVVSGHPHTAAIIAALVSFVVFQAILHYILRQVED